MRADEIREILEGSNALLQGHFLLTSGLHSPNYLEKFRLLQDPSHTEYFCTKIADRFRDEGVETVAGPALGGIILAYEVARQLGVNGVYAEREGEERVFRRGQSISPGERVLIVDDILTTGGSVREMVEAVAKARGEIVGIGLLIDRSSDVPEFNVPLYTCHRLDIPTYPPEECPQCKAGQPLTRHGSQV